MLQTPAPDARYGKGWERGRLVCIRRGSWHTEAGGTLALPAQRSPYGDHL
jgi:hypothetical protein